MSTTDYTKDLETLKTSLNQLNKEGLDTESVPCKPIKRAYNIA